MYKKVIGLEVHSELLTETKCFCGCKNLFGGEPNTHCCPVCLAMPGALPVLNQKAVEFTIKTGLAFGCSINPYSVFERKSYFYPDLSKAYQISQLEFPLCVGGGVEIEVDGKTKKIRFDRIHLEEDAGKLIHSKTGTLVDHNRGGVPLMELVSMPDLSSAEEAIAFIKKLRSTLIYLGVSDGKMQEGSLRCDVNLSLHREGEPLGTRTEMKNMNSFREIARAINYEAKRQEQELNAGRKIKQETLRWDSVSGKTFPMRSKEDSNDYRYFPDPDIIPIKVEEEYIKKIAATITRLPDQRKKEYLELGLTVEDAELITKDRFVADYFEEVIQIFKQPKFVCNWILGEVFKKLNTLEEDDEIKISASNMAKLLKLYFEEKIGQATARQLLDEIWESDADPEVIVQQKGLGQNNDSAELEVILRKMMAENASAVQDLKAGNQKTMAFFVGQAMRATSGKANPKIVNEIVNKLIKE